MKQVISVADFALMLNLVNDAIHHLECTISYDILQKYQDKETSNSKALKEHLERLSTSNSYYKSLLHLKQSLENCNIEVEVPDIKVEKE